MSFDRTDRVAEEVKRELSDIFRSLKDPRIPEMISILSVKVTKDFKYAKVGISTIGDETARNEAVKGLNSAAGFIRHEIGQRLQLRYTPQFTFVPDNSIEYGARISKLLTEIDRKNK